MQSNKISCQQTINGLSQFEEAIQDYLTTDISQDINLNGHIVYNSGAVIQNTQLATKAYVDSSIGGSGIKIESVDTTNNITCNNTPTGIVLQGSNLNMMNNKITNLQTATNPSDAVRYDQITSVPQYISSILNPVNGSQYIINHNLGYLFQDLRFDIFIQFSSNQSGYLPSDWIQIGSIDKTALINNTYGFQFSTVTGNDINNVAFQTAINGFFILDRNTQTSSNFNFVALSEIKIIISPNTIPSVILTNQGVLLSNVTVDTNLNMNGGKILNIIDDVSNQSVCTKSYVDLKRLKGDSLSTISTTSPMITDLTLNGRKATNSGLATASADLVPYSQIQGEFMAKTQSLDQIAAANPTSAAVNFNNQTITNLESVSNNINNRMSISSVSNDINFFCVGQQILNLNQTRLALSKYLDMNNLKIQNLLAPSNGQDAVNLNYFNNNVQTGIDLSNISSANPTSGNVNLNSHALTNITTASHSTNGYIKFNTTSQLGLGINNTEMMQIKNGNTDQLQKLTMNNFEIKLLGNATSLDAALNSNSADLRYGPINWRLDQISLANPTLDFIDMWTNRIVRCGNFVNAAPYMDAMNQISCDNRYMTIGATLNSIATLNNTSANVSMNFNKIIGLDNGTTQFDAVNMNQGPMRIPNIQFFSTPGVFTNVTVPAGYYRAKVYLQAGGGGSQYTNNNNGSYSGGGGGGGCGVKYFYNLIPTVDFLRIYVANGGSGGIVTPSLISATAGENSTVQLNALGTTWYANGGEQSDHSQPAGTILQQAKGGSSVCDKTHFGQHGGIMNFSSTGTAFMGNPYGGDSYFGQGGRAVYNYTTSSYQSLPIPIGVSSGYGGGASGSCTQTNARVQGQNGAQGCVRIIFY